MARIGVNVNKKEQNRINEMLLNRKPIIEQCKGCQDINGEFCNCYSDPSALFRNGKCLRAFHIADLEEPKTSGKKRVGQQKQKKKSRKK